MSVDAWGGGSDEDPKLRRKELGTYAKVPMNDPGTRTPVRRTQVSHRRKPIVSMWTLIQLASLLMACVIGYRHFS